MMSRKIFSLCLGVTTMFMFAACSVVEVSKEGEAVKLIEEAPPTSCKLVERIVLSSNLCDRDCQKASLINEAARLQADTLKIEHYGIANSQMTTDAIGLAYSCK
ncbi:MAG: hypothetical protein HQK50_16115 [Oligoflexia bacterium]|nr:hypothetical protein [Oligoflexia bacterium]MBF0367101.1 hypothetical protein [Oligoflexia bacterium]